MTDKPDIDVTLTDPEVALLIALMREVCAAHCGPQVRELMRSIVDKFAAGMIAAGIEQMEAFVNDHAGEGQ